MNRILNILFVCLSANISVGLAQDILSMEQAVNRAIENNYKIKLAENVSEIAKNNTRVFNTNQLPSVFMDGSGSYALDNTTANFQDGRSTSVSNAPSHGYQIGLNVSYTIFDGFMRKYNIKELGNRLELSELQVQAVLENTIALTMTQYYQVALLSNQMKTLDDNVALSKERLERAERLFDYGQSNRLAILNAEVDLNNDSLSLINSELLLSNAKRQLNNTMSVPQDLDYLVDPELETQMVLDRQELFESMLSNNTQLDLVNKDIQIGQVQLNLAEARRLPSLDFNSGYAYSYNKNNPAAFLASQDTRRLNLGLSARWNIFDGGATKTAIQNSKLNNINLELQKEQMRVDLALDFGNAWAQYENALFVLDNTRKNLSINEANFERTVEQYNAGQLSSVDYRQAQLNLSNANLALNNAMFEIKIAEIQLLLLSGRISE